VTDADPQDRFRRLFEASFDDLSRFVRRRISDGEDIVSETFTIAWRRLDQVPTDRGEARAWLFTVARGLMANRRRKDARLSGWQPPEIAEPDHTSATETRIDLARAFARLSGPDQECLALLAWDGLTPTQAATVLGITRSAFGVRVHRARRRLRAALNAGPASRPTSQQRTRSPEGNPP